MDIGVSDVIEASIFTISGTFEPRSIPETFADAVDTVLCHVAGETSISDGHGLLTVGSQLFKTFAGAAATSLIVPTAGGYFGRPIEIRSSDECDGNEVLVEVQIDDRVICDRNYELCPSGDDALDHFFDLVDEGVEPAEAWAVVTRAAR